MFARAVLINVKPGCDTKLTRTLDQEVLPLFRSKKDFRGGIALIFPQGTRALLIKPVGANGKRGCKLRNPFERAGGLARVVLGTRLV